MSKERVVVIGTGIVGSQMAGDMSADCDVTAVDANLSSLDRLKNKYPVKTELADLKNPQRVAELVDRAGLVLLAMPSTMSHNILGAVISSGKNVVDISFSNEDPFVFDKLAMDKKTTAVVDCGIAPGMANIITGHHLAQMKVESLVYECGGLPVVPNPIVKHNYQFGGAMDIYVRKPRTVKNGEIITGETFSGFELIHINDMTLEAIDTDGLRTLLRLKRELPNQVEKTLRYPGHLELMRTLKQAGFLSEEPLFLNKKILPVIEATAAILEKKKLTWEQIDYNSLTQALNSLDFLDDAEVEIRSSLDLTVNRLEDKWKPDGGKTMTIMHVTLKGTDSAGAPKQIEYSLTHNSKPGDDGNSLAKNTGYVATMVARFILGKNFNTKGIIAPEFIGMEHGALDFIINGLNERGIIYKKVEISV